MKGRSLLKLNNLVHVLSKSDIGKITEIYKNNTANISFFKNINLTLNEIIPLEDLKKIYLGNQTRIYNYTIEYGWRTGRVIDHEIMDDGSIEYEIKFSGGQYQEWLKEKDIEVRCLFENSDPTDVLAYSYGESQFLHDARVKVLNWIINLKESVKGLTAISSSSIDLVIHQINVAKKILSDPIQRYLLSDEVGMGKTIEAGIIARQCLIDYKDSTVLFIVPSHLIKKWENELFSKFYLNDYINRLEIISPEDIRNVKIEPTLTIVDEAHHIVSSFKYSKKVTDSIIEYCNNSEKLLLLSATPGYGDEEVLFFLLKLLDPNTYKTETIENFRLKLDKQREQGSFLRLIKPETSQFLLKRNLIKVSNLFPNDEVCLKLSNEILELIEMNQDFSNKIIELKTYITDTWNMHNRIIRTRRIDCEGWEFQERGKIDDEGNCYQNHIHLLTNPNPFYENINFKIENWRLNTSSIVNSLSSSQIKELQSRYIKLLEKSNGLINKFEKFIEETIKEPIYDDELNFLYEIKKSISDFSYDEYNLDVCSRIVDFLNNISENSIGIIFVDDLELGIYYKSLLMNILDEESILILDQVKENSDDLIKQTNIRIIIVDSKNEEGIDLQFADAIIHLDLLFKIARLEQRIGRLDRFGRKKSGTIQHLVLLPNDNDDYVWINWFELLVDGFKVFNSPISDIQLKLEYINENIFSDLLIYGKDSLVNHFDNGNIVNTKINYIQEIIQKERAYLDEQYAINHLALSESNSLNLRDSIEDGEYEEELIEDDIGYWLFSVLKFYKWNERDKVFKIKWNNNTLVPKQQFWAKDHSYVSELWAEKFQLSLNRNLTFNRNIAVNNNDTSLVRPGHPLFNNLEEYLSFEDRGTSFSTFRVVENDFPIFIPKGSVELIFKLVFLIGINKIETDGKFSKSTIERRCDEYFPPKLMTIYVDEKLNIIEESNIIDSLNEPYVRDRLIDTNLSSRHQVIESFIDKNLFIQLCKDVSENSKDFLLQSKFYKEYLAESLNRAKLDINRRVFLLEQKRKLSESLEFDELIKFENLILNSISNKEIKLDSFGVFFLSRYPIDELGLDIE